MGRPKKKLTRHRCSWTPEEDTYLKDQWGIISLSGIAEKLGRTNGATHKRAKDLYLGPALAASGAYTTHQIAEMLGVATSTVFNWVKDGKMQGHRFARENGRYAYRIYEENLLKWLKGNQSSYSAVNIPDYIFIDEPQWLKDKRKSDANSPSIVKSHWTTKEEQKLISMATSGMYSKREMIKAMNKTDKAVNAKLQRLRKAGLIPTLTEKERKKKQEEAILAADITPSDLEKLPNGRWKVLAQMKMVDLYETGCFKYNEIGELFDCTAKAIRSVLRKLQKKGVCKERGKTRKSYNAA
jgi:excisionase family DNA binding protein